MAISTLTPNSFPSKVASLNGITFPATQVISADANTLDDYEEGTWTPTLLFGGGSTGIVYSVQQASYTKIGRVVHCLFRLAYTTKSSSTGNAQIGGLPFPASGNDVSQGYSLGVFSFESNGATNIPVSPFALAWNDNSLYLRANTGTQTFYANLTNSAFGTTSEIWGSVVYRTA